MPIFNFFAGGEGRAFPAHLWVFGGSNLGRSRKILVKLTDHAVKFLHFRHKVLAIVKIQCVRDVYNVYMFKSKFAYTVCLRRIRFVYIVYACLHCIRVIFVFLCICINN